jgi:hypothetical protein
MNAAVRVQMKYYLAGEVADGSFSTPRMLEKSSKVAVYS